MTNSPANRTVRRVSFMWDQHYSSLGAILAVCLITLLIFTVGLSTICTNWMLGYAWICFFLWFMGATLASPVRVRRASGATQLLHGGAYVLVWAWFGLAIFPADLWSRNDVLWVAYLGTAVGIASWKKFLHMWLLRSLIRGALREVAGCPWLVAFSAGVSIDDSVPKAALRCKCLSIVSSIRSFHLFARFHSSMYGAIWNSQVCVEEVQYATDGRFRELRDALSTKHLDEVYRCALNAAEAYECESAVCSAIAVQTGEPVDVSIVRARALLVLESLLLAWLATDGKAASAVRVFEQGVSKWDSLAPLLARSASPIKLTSVLKLHDRDLLSFAADRQVDDFFHNFVVGMAYACVCIRGRYFRLANATLERVARDFADSSGKTSGGAKVLQTEATRIAHAFGAEVARAVWSTSHEGERAPSGDSSKPIGAGIRASVQAQRTHAMEQHGRGGDHPSIAPERDSRARISTERAGYLAPPTEPREVGRGIATVALAVLMLTIFVLLTNWNPPTNRIQHFFDVPSFGLVAASEITAQAMVEKTATILIGDKDDGVRTINLDTFRVDREDGPPATGPGGSVTHLATTANGTAFAIFETDPQHGPGVALRTSKGRWSTVLSASVAPIDGADVEALVPNLGRPLFLLKGGSSRIAEYDESARSLRFATTTGPAIEGAVVDVAATTGRTTSGRAIVATNAPKARVYLLESKANEREISIKEFSRLSLEGGHEASSIAIATSGTAVLVCKDGSAWQADANNVEKPWKQIRGGDQGLVLDGIQLAGLATVRSELWLFRKVGDKTTVWERSLPSSPSAPGHGVGWVQSELPPNIDPIVPGRTMFCELQGDGGVLLLTPAVDEKKMGAATHFQMTRSGTQESITCEVIPLGGKLLDADRAEGTLIALVESEDVNHSGVKTRTVVRFGEVGKPSKIQTAVSSTIFDEPATRLLESNNKIVAVGSVEQSNFLLFEDGKFVHFDGKTESLNWASAQQKSIVGKINFTSPVVDGTIDAPNGTPRVMLLSGNGSVDKGPIYKEDEVELKRIIDTSSGRPSSKELASTKGVITDSNNFCLVTKDALWRFNLQDALAPWSKVQTEFSEEQFFAIDSAGTPLVMGRTKVASKEVRAFGSDGKSTDWAATEVHDLVPGVGIAAFGSDKDGVLYSFDKARGRQAHFRSTDSGPLEVQSVAVRPEYLDFRASRTLHSFSRTDGSWDKSEEFDSDCSFTVGGMRASPILFLVPKSKGIPRWLPTGMAAGKLQKLGSISLRKAVSTTDGVIGLTGDIGNGIAFSSVEAVPPNEFVSTEAKNAKINIARPKAIVDFGNSFWIQSDADKLYRYTPSQLKTEIVQTGGLSVDALDATKERLFAKSNNEILTFTDANSTKAAAQVSVKDLLAMGRPIGSFIPAITNGGGLFRVDVGTSTPLLASRQPELSIGKIDRVLAMGDSLYVYSGNAGFERTASGLDPFKPLPHITTAPTRILPHGDEIWLESSEGWMRQGDGETVGKSIGWFSDGKLLSLSSWFKDAPDGLGDLRGFHQLDDRRLLMLGTKSIAIFDPSTRSFEQIDGAKGEASDFGDGTALYKAGSGNFLWKPRGKVYELVAGGDSTFKILPRCGGNVVSSLAIVSNRLVGFVDGVLYNEDGTLLPNQPQPASGALLEIEQVLTDEQGRMYRLSRDGVVDLFDINTAQRTEIEKGVKHLAFHGKDVIWCKETTPWFGGSDFELRFSISDGLRVITNSGTSQPIRKPDEIPGKIVAQIPMTGIVLCEFEREKYRLYDFVSAKKIPAEASGKLVGATKDGFYILAQGSKELILVDREGKKKSVGAEKIVATCSVDGSVDAFALKDRTASPIDPITLEYQQAKVEPYSKPMLVATIDEKATLYVSPTKFVLKGTDSIVSAERGNPLGKDLGLQVFQSSSAITVLDDAKKQILVVASKQGEQWTLSNSGLAEAPNATTRAEALGAECTPNPAGKGADDRIKVERGTLEPSTGLILEEQVLAILLDVGVISKQNGLLAWEQLSKCTDPWQHREIAKSFTQLLGSKHPHMGDAILQPADSGIPPHKEYVACAAFSSKDFVLVDALGQLWHQHAGDELPNFIQKVGKQAKFSIDPADKGALFVSFDKTRYRLTISGDRVQSKLDQSMNRELLPDWTHVGGRYGLLEWGPSLASSPTKFFLRCNDKEKFPIKPTVGGFDCFMASELGTFAKGQTFVKLGVKDKAVFAPVRENGVDWMNASVKNAVEFKQFSSVEPPKITKLSDGTEFRLNGESVICRIGEMEFKFDSKIKRFQCDSGIAETIQNGEFLVTATKSGQLIKRRLSSKLLFEATSIFPKVFPEESTGTIERLSPNDEMNSIIAETSDGSSWEWAVNKWMPVTHPTFINKNKSKWNRIGDREFQWDGETYELDATGSFQCDHVNSKRDNDDRQYHAICNRDGSISYRGSDNSWYSVSMSIPMPRRVPQGRVPQPADTIPESKSEVGWLKVDRHPRAGDKSLMSITFEGGEPRSVDLPFAIKDGLLDGVDNWDLERPLQANEDKTVIVRCQGSDLERKLDFTKDGTITILRPNAAKVANLNWNAPPASDGEFKLTNTSCTRVNKQSSVEFGTPTTKGFALLNPFEISPLGMKDNKLYWEQGGNLYCRTGEAPTGITDLGRVPISGTKSLKRIWQSSENGNPKLFFEKYGATFDLSKGELVQCIARPSASPICLASPPPESLIAKWFGDESIQDKSIQFDRAGKRPIEKMVFRLTDTAGPAFDHQKGVKHLKAKGDSVSTLSDDWQATYRFVGGQWGLETVVKANPAIKTIDLNNGLRADWTEAGYTVNNSKAMGKVEPWSTRALLGPTRVFVHKAGITEAGKNWWRTRKWDDTIVHRPEVMDGLPLATAYRAGDQLVSDNVAWALDNQGGIAKSGLRGSFDPPGMVDTVVTAWKVQLNKGGGACKIHYNERPLTVKNGAVDIDYAITAATSDEMVTLIDRGGVECLSMKASWSKHTDEVVAKLQDFQPTKTLTLGEDHLTLTLGGDHLARVFKASGPLEYFRIPSTSDGALVPDQLKERAIESWTAGGILRASLDEDDKVRFTHVYPDGSEKKPFNYPAISRADAITHGRCACDYPIDVFRAKSDDQVWLKLKFTQSEVYEALDDQGKPIDLTTTKQDVAPSLFDRDGVAWIRDDKSIEARDDAERIAELSRAVKAALGKPKLWYRRGDRIFVVGESDAGWIEMSPRWSGLPLKH